MTHIQRLLLGVIILAAGIFGFANIASAHTAGGAIQCRESGTAWSVNFSDYFADGPGPGGSWTYSYTLDGVVHSGSIGGTGDSGVRHFGGTDLDPTVSHTLSWTSNHPNTTGGPLTAEACVIPTTTTGAPTSTSSPSTSTAPSTSTTAPASVPTTVSTVPPVTTPSTDSSTPSTSAPSATPSPAAPTGSDAPQIGTADSGSVPPSAAQGLPRTGTMTLPIAALAFALLVLGVALYALGRSRQA